MDEPKGRLWPIDAMTHKELALIRQQSEQYSWLSLHLWYNLYDLPHQQGLAGTGEAEIRGFLQMHGDLLRRQVATGNLEAIPRFWWHATVGTEAETEQLWRLLGITPEEARAWLEAWARQRYAAMDEAHMEYAAQILLTPGYADLNWDRVLGSGASQRLAQAAIAWTQSAYAYLRQTNLDAAAALDQVGMPFIEFVISRYGREVAYRRPETPVLSIYPHFGFTCDEALELYYDLVAQTRR